MALPSQLVRRNRTYHGMTKSRVYKIWTGMLSRCNTPSATSYENYGGRGIKVCDRWNSFELFLEDMGEPKEGQSIERENGALEYGPENCRWATKKEQNRNQRDLVYVTFDGKTQCLSAWAEQVGSTYSTLKARMRLGWTVESLLCTPVRGHKVYERRDA